MRIVKFIIENYKALRGHHEFIPDGANFILIGANGAGKTSAGRAIIDILTKNIPSKPITDGENAGMVEYTFDNGQRLLTRFSDNGTNKLELLSAEGLKINTPKELIAKLTGTGMAFDIDEFMSMQPKPRRELLEKIAGVDLSELNKQEKDAEIQRRDLNAAAKAAEARVKPYDKNLADLDIVNTSEAVETLKAMTENNAAYQRVDAGISQRQRRQVELIAELEKIEAEIAKGLEWKDANVLFSESEIENQETLIKQADEIKDAKRLKADAELAKDATAKAKAKDTEIRNIREQKEMLIRSAILPAEGLAFDVDTDDLLIDGIPFESNQIAASRKLIAAVQIAASMLGDIRYLHFDGAALDKKSADTLLSWAEAHDLQLCLERPLWEGGDGVMMEIIERTDIGDTPKKGKDKNVKVAENTVEKAPDISQSKPKPEKAQLPW